MSRFDAVVEVLGIREGELSLDPRDDGNWTGGRQGVGRLKGTKFGIAANSYPDVDIPILTWAAAKAIYRRDYWDRIRADELGQPLDEYLFDLAVNSGARRAAQILQAAVGTLQDGVIGPKTLAAVKARPVRDVLRLVFVERAMIFALSPRDSIYGRGWFGRLFDTTETALLSGRA